MSYTARGSICIWSKKLHFLISVFHLESDDEDLFLRYRSGQRCRSHFEGVAVWIKAAGPISVTVGLTLAAWTVAELIRLMNVGGVGGGWVQRTMLWEERRGQDRLTSLKIEESEIREARVGCVSASAALSGKLECWAWRQMCMKLSSWNWSHSNRRYAEMKERKNVCVFTAADKSH